MKPTALVVANVLFRNSVSGRIGSSALLSTKTKAGSSTDAQDDQPDDLRRPPRPGRPAKARESTIDVSVPASRAAPR